MVLMWCRVASMGEAKATRPEAPLVSIRATLRHSRLRVADLVARITTVVPAARGSSSPSPVTGDAAAHCEMS